MKKTISVIVAIAMMFVMCIPAFATEGESVKPTDPAELGVYYAELLNAEGSDPVAVAQMILDDLIMAEGDEGIYAVTDLPAVLTAFASNVVDETKLAAVAEQVEAGLAGMGVVLPDVDDMLPPADEDEESTDAPEEEETLPEDDSTGGVSDFLNTILGILGSIGDMIFGGGDSGSSGDEGTTDEEDAWGDDSSDDGESDDLVPDTGNTTVISVAAVALVAGAALVLTRKKTEE